MAGQANGRPGRLLRLVPILALSLTMACAPTFRNHGYVPAEDDLALLIVGQDTRDTVEVAVGRPSAAGLLNDDGWYYVQSRYRQMGPRAPQEIERQVVAISFDEGGTVTNIERFGLEDGRVVALSRRVTETNIKGASLIRQLLRNFGRFNAGDFLRREEG